MLACYILLKHRNAQQKIIKLRQGENEIEEIASVK